MLLVSVLDIELDGKDSKTDFIALGENVALS